MKPLLAVQHTPVETLGTLEEALRAAGVPYEYVRTREGEPVPESAEGLGGPMGVYETERYPHLEKEIQLIKDALEREIPVLGACLGSQLLASSGPTPVQAFRFGECWTPSRTRPGKPERTRTRCCARPPSTFRNSWPGPDGSTRGS